MGQCVLQVVGFGTRLVEHPTPVVTCLWWRGGQGPVVAIPWGYTVPLTTTLCRFPDQEVRRTAVQWIDSISDTELLDYLPQLVQVCAAMGVLHGMCSETGMQCDTRYWDGGAARGTYRDWDAAADVCWVGNV